MNTLLYLSVTCLIVKLKFELFDKHMNINFFPQNIAQIIHKQFSSVMIKVKFYLLFNFTEKYYLWGLWPKIMYWVLGLVRGH